MPWSPEKGSYVSQQPGEASREGQTMSRGTKQLAGIRRFAGIYQNNSTPATSRQSYDEVFVTCGELTCLLVSLSGSLDTAGLGFSCFSPPQLPIGHLLGSYRSLWSPSSRQSQVLSLLPGNNDTHLVFSPASAAVSLPQPHECCHHVAQCR